MSIKFDYERMRVASMRKIAAPGSGSLGGIGSSSGSGGIATTGFGGGGFSGGFGPGAGSGRGNNHNRYNPVYDDLSEGTIIEQFMPVDPRRLHRIWRRIYLQDPVAGPAIELYKDLPWSDFQLIGIDDRAIIQLYTDALNAINITSRLPEISAEFLSMGKVIGHCTMDESKGYWDRMIIHDPDWIRITPIPVPGFQPMLDIIPTPDMRSWAASKDPRAVQAQNEIRDLVELINAGKEIPLPTENTFYIPRKMSPYDAVGASAYTRIIMFVAYEKALVNATITAARRRASRIRHVQAGIDDVWEPSKEELDDYASLFMQADEDPVGAIVVTRTGVQVQEVGGNSPQDMVKISDEWQFLSTGKLNALGVSEQFITGDATYNSLEQLMSVFLEKVKAHRTFFVHNLIKEKLLKPLAVKHKFVRRTQAELKHGVRISSSTRDSDYILPTIAFEKSLRPVADRDYLEILGMMEEKGIPITVRTWSSAAGFDLDSEMEQFSDDVSARRQLSDQKKKLMAVAPEAAGGGGGAGGGLGGGDLGGLGGGLGGGDLGGLGGLGGGLDLGGGGAPGGAPEPGGAPGGPGGAPGGGAGGGLELPQIGASVRTASTASRARTNATFVEALHQLPIWDKKKEFMGIEQDNAELVVRRLLDYLGTKTAKTVTRSDALKILSTGHNKRDQVMRYVISRTGLIQNADISREVGVDIQEALVSRLADYPDKLLVELRQVAACVHMNARDALAKRADDVERRINVSLESAQKLGQRGVPGEHQGNRLLTGYVDKDPEE